MHILFREGHGLEEGEQAVDPGGTPADILFLSFSDSDLSAAAAATLPADFPSVRLERISRFLHPLSVDLLCEQLVAKAHVVVIRLLGGIDYWRYGIEEIAATCRANGIPLAVLPGDGRGDDPKLAAISTMDAKARLAIDRCLRESGADNLARAFQGVAHAAGLWPDVPATAQALPACGLFGQAQGAPDAVILFYRSHLLAGETAPVSALADALAERGLGVRALYVDSLKNPDAAAFVRDWLIAWKPSVILNLTGFSARLGDAPSPLEAGNCPILQCVQAGSSRSAWDASARGLSQADLAMQVVLPEADGRLLTTAISFKERDETGQARLMPDKDGIALAADRAVGWVTLAETPAADRRLAVILSDYPAAAGPTSHELGYAVGLDSLASVSVILHRLSDAGYETGGDLAPVDLAALARREVLVLGNIRIAVQPDRAASADRKTSYHDPDAPPSSDYIAFYDRLRTEVHALIHLGTHGTLEWLPGKPAALSADCWPVRLTRGLPVIYPFIVNNPGEAAPAKRRLGAVTIGHLTPPLQRAGLSGRAEGLERLIDEFAAADGLDRRRATSLEVEILTEARATGLLAESGARLEEEGEDAALAKLDAYLCDVKDMQIRDGLHVFGQAPAPAQRAGLVAALVAASPDIAPEILAAKLDSCAVAEMGALLAALDGRFIPPGPAGAPTRGRADVLPTGRNLVTFDPRLIPTSSAMQLAEKAARALLARHRQEQGDWPRALVIDLWGSATMRTGGEDFALGLILLGVRPLWDSGTGRVNGFEVLPLAEIDRPRVDVSLRISGLFRDAFAGQIALFDQAVRAVAGRDEPADLNPLAGALGARVFGPQDGRYGSGVDLSGSRVEIARGYAAGSTAMDGSDEDFSGRIAAADGFVHAQDHSETDILESPDYAAHEGGFAAAAASLGALPALYHLDTANPDAPKLRTIAEEIRRVVRGRAANPRWIAGQMRHGFRGAADIARAAESLTGFAVTLPDRFDAQFDLLFDATLGDEAVALFLAAENPAALAAMQRQFNRALSEDLWRPRRNSLSVLATEAVE
ncbi:cobaltochelatase subunit CobN [Acidisoma cellulosilytica]|uniref:Cobaltochelatase subunit CobN n=1 Tax=Acidisoma cellulosilyticum TaxID=2802395 RepID=A0A963YZ85_9PROT|nr:cobaltochelatase subunit CobN [Acidisoma cellulosilyticum]MCB8879814.1 cobaltochelatase subunit CobN [Acidisoma cellulosilyticum]